jgi:hypothetical protein
MPERDAEWTLYVTEGEIVRRMGVGINSGRKALQEMKKHPKFPPKAIGGKYYWGSMVDFLDLWNGRARPLRQDANHEPIVARSRTWAALEAAKERLGHEVARALDADPDLQSFIASENERLANGGRRRPSFELATLHLALRRAQCSEEQALIALHPSPKGRHAGGPERPEI